MDLNSIVLISLAALALGGFSFGAGYVIRKWVAERLIRTGLLDEKLWEKHLKSLDDQTENCSPVDTVMTEADLDDDEDDE